jgi:hypothetical protein
MRKTGLLMILGLALTLASVAAPQASARVVVGVNIGAPVYVPAPPYAYVGPRYVSPRPYVVVAPPIYPRVYVAPAPIYYRHWYPRGNWGRGYWGRGNYYRYRR